MKALFIRRKKQHGFTLLEFIIILAVFNGITLIVVPFYLSTMKHKAWTQTMVATNPLKQAITRCLQDNKGYVGGCNDFSADKLARYGIAQAPASDVFVVAVRNDAAIKIVGSNKLGSCTAILTPKVSVSEGLTKWECIMQKTKKTGDSLQKCRKYVPKCSG